MKEFLKTTKYKIKKIVSFKKINPHRHWENLLHTFFIFTAILVLFSFYLLYQIENQQIFKTKTQSTIPVVIIDEKLLQKIQESFNDKAIRVEDTKNKLKIYTDPSIAQKF